MIPKNRTLNLLALVCFASSLFMRATDPAIPRESAAVISRSFPDISQRAVGVLRRVAAITPPPIQL